jgi:hypothetical protein
MKNLHTLAEAGRQQRIAEEKMVSNYGDAFGDV